MHAHASDGPTTSQEQAIGRVVGRPFTVRVEAIAEVVETLAGSRHPCAVRRVLELHIAAMCGRNHVSAQAARRWLSPLGSLPHNAIDI